jgi:hypothetical protein
MACRAKNVGSTKTGSLSVRLDQRQSFLRVFGMGFEIGFDARRLHAE